METIFLTVVMNLLIFRSWWNRREDFHGAVLHFSGAGGETVNHSTHGPVGFSFRSNFNWDLFLSSAQAFRERNGAYNPGTHGCAKGCDVVEAWVKKLRGKIEPSLRASLPYFMRLQRMGPASQFVSDSTLKYFQKLIGKFVGYQVALDVGYFFPQFFDEAAHVFCGPGALAVLRQIFVNAPWPSTGMVSSSICAAAAEPFIYELQGLLETHPSAQALRDCSAALSLPLPCVNDVEYHSCEMRQLEHERIYMGSGQAPEWYVDAMDDVLFKKALRCSTGEQPPEPRAV